MQNTFYFSQAMSIFNKAGRKVLEGSLRKPIVCMSSA